MAELSKTYDPGAVESKWYRRWLDDGAFHADANSAKPSYSIVMPPPNVTGVLTLGHVLNNTIQDVLARHARMRGHEVLWLPGTDHAGLATQTAVEKWLRKNEKVSRHDLGREEFLRRTWEWCEKHGGIIIEQLKRLGCSCDWSRQRFTLDADYAGAVQQVFVDLCAKGLIYRGRRMINWDPVALTALSDEEVIPTPQKSTLYFVRYELVDEPRRYLEVATTRPETIMADTAVAVNPTDPRYANLIGRKVWRPLAREELPIIGDSVIDPEFGTGVLKVTPAHDKVDYEIGLRHQLPVIDILHDDGRINCAATPELDRLDRFEARKKAAELLAEAGLLAKEEPYQNTVGFSERAGVPIEPRISEQWFLRYPRTDEALRVVREHLIRFFPSHWEKVYEQWLTNIQDWCISRQVWWGHRVPVWTRTFPNDYDASAEAFGWEKSGTPYSTGFHRVRGEVVEVVTSDPAAAPLLEKHGYAQDPDTLDTWFSSWLWAYATMDPATRKKFYPTSVLVTAPDIIFFWVARMIIAGLEFTPGASKRDEDNIAFRDVYFTGLIRDRSGRKMSKSLGNSPDPLELIGKYGADGLRFGLMRIAPSGQDIRFDEKQIEEGRNFATKLWNAARFRQMHGPISAEVDLMQHKLSIYAVEVVSRLNETIEAVEVAYREYRFNDVAQRLYDFFWGDYCDWFLEAAKTEITSEEAGPKAAVLAVMDHVLSAVLRLLHPLMPHITEELWNLLGFGTTSIQFVAPPNPTNLGSVESARGRVGAIYETVRIARNLRAEARIPSNKKSKFALRASIVGIEAELPTIARLVNAETLTIQADLPTVAGATATVTPLGELYLMEEAPADKAAERERLDKEIAKIEKELETVNRKLANSSFVDNAPRPVVDEHRDRKAKFTERRAQLQRMRAAVD